MEVHAACSEGGTVVGFLFCCHQDQGDILVWRDGEKHGECNNVLVRIMIGEEHRGCTSILIQITAGESR